ncbi:hypothetical protein A2U01_0084242, partial [Trifolium medium]|nr:hypothetical protein [Trifolium medium]
LLQLLPVGFKEKLELKLSKENCWIGMRLSDS